MFFSHYGFASFATDGVQGKITLTTFHSSKDQRSGCPAYRQQARDEPGIVHHAIGLSPWLGGRHSASLAMVPVVSINVPSARSSAKKGGYSTWASRVAALRDLICSEAYVYKGHIVSLGASRFARDHRKTRGGVSCGTRMSSLPVLNCESVTSIYDVSRKANLGFQQAHLL